MSSASPVRLTPVPSDSLPALAQARHATLRPRLVVAAPVRTLTYRLPAGRLALRRSETQSDGPTLSMVPVQGSLGAEQTGLELDGEGRVRLRVGAAAGRVLRNGQLVEPGGQIELRVDDCLEVEELQALFVCEAEDSAGARMAAGHEQALRFLGRQGRLGWRTRRRVRREMRSHGRHPGQLLVQERLLEPVEWARAVELAALSSAAADSVRTQLRKAVLWGLVFEAAFRLLLLW